MTTSSKAFLTKLTKGLSDYLDFMNNLYSPLVYIFRSLFLKISNFQLGGFVGIPFIECSYF